MTDTLSLPGGRPLRGTIAVPGDKSISHRALLLAAVAEGTSEVRGLSDGHDVRRTAAAVAALGATVEGSRISGGRARLKAPSGPLDMGNSGTTIRLLAGLLAGWDFGVTLEGDASLSSRPMDRVAVPLRLMGASVEGQGEFCLPPLQIRGGKLEGIDYTPPMASAQVKSCVLLAGLTADGETVVREPVPTRLHTEEMLALCGADIDVQDGDDGSHVVRLRASELRPFEIDVPGDPSQAAFWVVAGCVVPGSDITVERVYVGPGRRGYLDVLGRMGADIEEAAETGRAELGATATLRARYRALQATAVDASEITGLDEVPVLAVAAACAEGTTVFLGMGELRVKESDRLTAVADLVRAFGGSAEIVGDDLAVHGGTRLTAAVFDAKGDHRMAMAAAVAAAAVGENGSRAAVSSIGSFDSVDTSYPGFGDDLARLAGDGAGERRVTKIVAIDGPAGAGKSTLAQAVAEHLGLERLDSGAMYRAVAWQALAEGLDPDAAEAVAALARRLDIQVGDRVTVDGVDVSDEIRSEQVDRAVSAVAANPAVRTNLVDRQRRWVSERGAGVVEGRDIGTVVLPDADLKVYLTARTGERARRRAEERADGRSVAEVEADLERRDRLDSTRSVSPLIMPEDVADDAVIIDSTGKSADQVLREVLRCL